MSPAIRSPVPGALLALSLAALVACAPGEGEGGVEPGVAEVAAEPQLPLPNLLLVVLDTVRADHVSCYGYARRTTPALDAFAVNATRFTRAFASAPWTLPSHASMFTGLDPREHGVQTLMTPSRRIGVRPLAEEHVTLAEALAEVGYRTGAFVANRAYLSPRYGVAQGFETWHAKHEPGLMVNLAATRWLAQEDGRPWFLFVNYMDAHRPYVTFSRPEVVPEPVDRDGMARLDELLEAVLPGEEPPPAELVASVVDQYDLGIASADEALGRLLEHLAGADDGRAVVVAITSDHGEYLGEHALVEHSKDVYQPGLMVPFVLGRLGEEAGRVDERTVVSADLPNLLIDAADHPRLAPLLERFPRAPGGHPARMANAYAREKDVLHPVWGRRFQRVRDVVVEWPWKLIHSSDGEHELYHLGDDPGELDNRYADEPERVRALRAQLEEPAAASVADEEEVPELDAAERERLRALGYAE